MSNILHTLATMSAMYGLITFDLGVKLPVKTAFRLAQGHSHSWQFAQLTKIAENVDWGKGALEVLKKFPHYSPRGDSMQQLHWIQKYFSERLGLFNILDLASKSSPYYRADQVFYESEADIEDAVNSGNLKLLTNSVFPTVEGVRVEQEMHDILARIQTKFVEANQPVFRVVSGKRSLAENWLLREYGYPAFQHSAHAAHLTSAVNIAFINPVKLTVNYGVVQRELRPEANGLLGMKAAVEHGWLASGSNAVRGYQLLMQIVDDMPDVSLVEITDLLSVLYGNAYDFNPAFTLIVNFR